jgi:DNA (cytosine-5)-methyltransferase 1
MLSIFATPDEAKVWARDRRAEGWEMGTPRRPLAEATLRRIARGVQRFVLDAAEPFIVSLAHGYSGGRREFDMEEPLGTQHSGGNKFAVVTPFVAGVGGRQGQSPERSVGDPYQTITAKADSVVVAPYLIPRYGERDGQEPRTLDITEPHPTVVPSGNGASLVASFLARHWGGMVGKELTEPFPTITARGTQDQVAAVHMERLQRNAGGASAAGPLGTVRAAAEHHGLVASFLQRYNGQGVGSATDEPIPTLSTKDRMSLVTVEIDGDPYVLVDIAMRMLQPRELYRAQGFPDSYRIERGVDGRVFTKTEQVRMVGNSVSPQVAAAIVRANCPSLIARDEARKVWVA